MCQILLLVYTQRKKEKLFPFIVRSLDKMGQQCNLLLDKEQGLYVHPFRKTYG